MDGERVESIRLRPAEGLRYLAFAPDLEVLITGARAVLPDVVAWRDAMTQVITAASLPLTLEQRPDLLLPATKDRLHQFHRSELIPASWTLLRRLRKVGVPTAISGAGPVAFVIGMEYRLVASETIEHEEFQCHDLGIGGGAQLPD